MRGRVRDGRLSLGQVDRLLPPPSGAALPPARPADRRQRCRARARHAGRAGSRSALAGRGNLADGFRGRSGDGLARPSLRRMRARRAARRCRCPGDRPEAALSRSRGHAEPALRRRSWRSSGRCSRSTRCSRRRSTAGAARRRTARPRSGPERAALAGVAGPAQLRRRLRRDARQPRCSKRRAARVEALDAAAAAASPAITRFRSSAASWRSTATSPPRR